MRLAREYGSEGIVADKADDAQTLGAQGQVGLHGDRITFIFAPGSEYQIS